MHPSRWGRGRSAARLGLLVVVVTALVLGGLGLARWGVDPSQPPVADAAAGAPRNSANSAALQSVSVLHTLRLDGANRTYRSYVPTGPAGHWPLIVVLHGRGQGWQTAVEQTGFLGLAHRHQAVLVFPDGIGRSWNAGAGCCGLAGKRKLPDVAFVASVLADALHRLPVDPTRVYLVGYSNGGKLAYNLNCTHPTAFAALATYGSAPLAACPAGTPPTPFLIAAGQRDTILPYEGAAKAHPPTPSIRTALDWLRTQDGCTGPPTLSNVGHVRQQDWTHCKAGSEVRSVVYTDVGHAWPSTPKQGSPSVSNLMWQFLISHRLPGVSMPERDATATRNP